MLMIIARDTYSDVWKKYIMSLLRIIIVIIVIIVITSIVIAFTW